MNKDQRIKSDLLFYLKLTIAIVLYAIILKNVDWNHVPQALEHSNFLLIAFVWICMVLNIFVSTLKWKLLLSSHGIHFFFNKLSKLYFISFFLNNFFPSTIGGDGYRLIKTMNNSISKASAAVAIFTERVTGILALLFLGLISGVVNYLYFYDDLSLITIIFGLTGLCASIPFFFSIYSTKCQKWLSEKTFVPEKIKNFLAYMKDYRSYPLKSFYILCLSFFFHTLFIFFRLLLILAVGGKITFTSMTVSVVISSLVALIPISLNGIGLLDGSFIYCLTNYGVEYEQAVIVMLLIRLLQIPLSLIGGTFYVFNRKFVEE